jgi:hypothetical protein
MMTASELAGLASTLEVLQANGFGSFKEEIKIVNYILNFGEKDV